MRVENQHTQPVRVPLAHIRGARRDVRPAWMTKGLGIGTQMFGGATGDLWKPVSTWQDAKANEHRQWKQLGSDPSGQVLRESASGDSAISHLQKAHADALAPTLHASGQKPVRPSRSPKPPQTERRNNLHDRVPVERQHSAPLVNSRRSLNVPPESSRSNGNSPRVGCQDHNGPAPEAAFVKGFADKVRDQLQMGDSSEGNPYIKPTKERRPPMKGNPYIKDQQALDMGVDDVVLRELALGEPPVPPSAQNRIVARPFAASAVGDDRHERFEEGSAPKGSMVPLKRSSPHEKLSELCGQWFDQKGSTYKLVSDGPGSLSVATTRPHGATHKTNKLIRLDRRTEKIVFGLGACVFKLEEFGGQSLLWAHPTNPRWSYRWLRTKESAPASTTVPRSSKRDFHTTSGKPNSTSPAVPEHNALLSSNGMCAPKQLVDSPSGKKRLLSDVTPCKESDEAAALNLVRAVSTESSPERVVQERRHCNQAQDQQRKSSDVRCSISNQVIAACEEAADLARSNQKQVDQPSTAAKHARDIVGQSPPERPTAAGHTNPYVENHVADSQEEGKPMLQETSELAPSDQKQMDQPLSAAASSQECCTEAGHKRPKIGNHLADSEQEDDPMLQEKIGLAASNQQNKDQPSSVAAQQARDTVEQSSLDCPAAAGHHRPNAENLADSQEDRKPVFEETIEIAESNDSQEDEPTSTASLEARLGGNGRRVRITSAKGTAGMLTAVISFCENFGEVVAMLVEGRGAAASTIIEFRDGASAHACVNQQISKLLHVVFCCP